MYLKLEIISNYNNYYIFIIFVLRATRFSDNIDDRKESIIIEIKRAGMLQKTDRRFERET